MKTILVFVTEASAQNLIGILLGIAAIALILGTALRNKTVVARTVLYSVGGTIGGILNYMSIDKQPEYLHIVLPTLGIAFFLLCLLFISPIMWFRTRRGRVEADQRDGT